MSHHIGHITFIFNLGKKFKRLMSETVFRQCVEHLNCTIVEPICAYLVEDFLKVCWVIGFGDHGGFVKGIVRRRWVCFVGRWWC
ncbi:hypothetical protein HanIR_Chr04g0176451 [Helianthus annuus]|nr:hypothetical protein HanIR_Chr04g0176451 [Helianthus annuus]